MASGCTVISRRSVLAFGTAIAISAERKLKILVTGGHPGDPEYGCGGTIARYSDAGHEVVLLYLNEGDVTCAAKNPPRVPEAKRACEILKARPRFAGQCDGHAVVDPERCDAFRKILEEERPDILFTHWPVDNHADHRAISMLAYDAWLRMNRSFAFYYYEVSDGEDTVMFTPTDYVNIEATSARKRAACYAHASQSPDRYYALQSGIARFRGAEIKKAEAEAFLRHTQSRAGILPV